MLCMNRLGFPSLSLVAPSYEDTGVKSQWNLQGINPLKLAWPSRREAADRA